MKQDNTLQKDSAGSLMSAVNFPVVDLLNINTTPEQMDEFLPALKITHPIETKFEKFFHVVLLENDSEKYLAEKYSLTVIAARDATRITEDEKYIRGYMPFKNKDGKIINGATTNIYQEQINALHAGNDSVQRGVSYIVALLGGIDILTGEKIPVTICNLDIFELNYKYWYKALLLGYLQKGHAVQVNIADHKVNLKMSKNNRQYLNPNSFIQYEPVNVGTETKNEIQKALSNVSKKIENWLAY